MYEEAKLRFLRLQHKDPPEGKTLSGQKPRACWEEGGSPAGSKRSLSCGGNPTPRDELVLQVPALSQPLCRYEHTAGDREPAEGRQLRTRPGKGLAATLLPHR